MGVIILAKCSCGFEQDLRADRGKIVKGPTCLAPTLCTQCNKLQSLNYAINEVHCPECNGETVYYNDPTLKGTSSEGERISWGMDLEEDFVLPKSQFICPNCGETNLEFRKVGHWD